MKQFIAFVHKEFYHIFRDIRTMMILLGMPIIQIIIFGFALNTDIKDIRVSILNPNEDIVSRKIIERIDASEYFIVDRYLHTSNEIEKEFKEGNIYTPLNPINRFTMPEEVAQYAKMLVSDLGNTIVGQTLYMSGGRGIIEVR